MTVLHAGYVLQQCFDVALAAHIEILAGLWHRVPPCKFFGHAQLDLEAMDTG
jgi:hypothetical protein